MARSITNRLPLLVLGTMAACGGARGYVASSPEGLQSVGPQYPAYPSSPAAPTAAGDTSPPAEVAKEGAERIATTEEYKDYGVNPAIDPAKDRLSTFAIDVDTASYSISRRKLLEGTLPPFAAVRAEEFLNYFDYGYASPRDASYAVYLTGAPSPLTAGHHLLRVVVQAKRIASAERRPVHLVYLVDTSGSMQSDDKIGLAKKSLKILTGSLKSGDTVALCTYAGTVREILPPTGVDHKDRILAAIDGLTADGSTAMSSGIELAYNLAERSLVKGDINHVVVLSDGDANVGDTTHEAILKRIEHFKGEGITLSTVGFGDGNYKDTMMEQLADKGDGNYSYIDSEQQAERVFAENVNGLLEVVARDMKVQVDFDPSVVSAYRLVGYENRDVADQDFRNDKVDGGEIGAGHAVTAMYDVVLKRLGGSPFTVRVRSKAPAGSEQATERAFPMPASAVLPSFDAAPANFRFATAVVGFAEILRQSPYAKAWSLEDVERIARASAADRRDQQEMIDLVRRAERLMPTPKATALAK
jgi:Ca-activated chloride channel family protein